MFAPLLIVFLVVPIIELYVLMQVGREIGVPLTLVALIGMSIAGAWLLKREGTATWIRLRATLAEGRMPTGELTDGAMILVGGALMLTPGFVTDVMGLLLILPPTRAPLKSAFRKILGGWFLGRVGRTGRAGRAAYTAHVVRSRRVPREPGSAQPPTPVSEETTPSSSTRDSSDDSRDTA